MYQANVYKIFLASPGDVAKERQITREVIQKWNELYSEHTKIVLQTIGWETHSYSSMEGRAQEILNKQILKDSDFLIGMFWTRIGTPTGEHQSGTLEEIREHIESGKPAMICFSNQPVALNSLDQEQYNKLMAFKNECFDMGLVSEFEDLEQFRNLINESIIKRINSSDPFVSFSKQISDISFQQSTLSNQQDLPRIDENSKALLLEASDDPNGEIMKISYLGGSTIQSNGRDFIENMSGREIAKWEAALNALLTEKLVEAVGNKGTIFHVTHYGYEVADRLKNT